MQRRKGVNNVEIIIKGEAKEIAALVVAIQERQSGEEPVVLGARYSLNLSHEEFHDKD